VIRVRVSIAVSVMVWGLVFTTKMLLLFSVKILVEDSESRMSVFHEFSPKITPCDWDCTAKEKYVRLWL